MICGFYKKFPHSIMVSVRRSQRGPKVSARAASSAEQRPKQRKRKVPFLDPANFIDDAAVYNSSPPRRSTPQLDPGDPAADVGQLGFNTRLSSTVRSATEIQLSPERFVLEEDMVLPEDDNAWLRGIAGDGG